MINRKEGKGITALVANSLRDNLKRSAIKGSDDPLALFSLGLGFPLIKPHISELDRIASRGLGKKVNEKLPDATWARPPRISDSDDSTSKFSEAWEALTDKFSVWSALKNADILMGSCHFAGIYINLSISDDEDISQPAKWESYNLSRLIGFEAYGEQGIPYKPGLGILTSGSDRKSERFGLPTEYNIQTRGVDVIHSIGPIHWSRVVHLAASAHPGPIGEPRLLSSYNTLLSMFKIYASAEGIKRAGTKTVAELAEGAMIDDDDAAILMESYNRMNDDLSDLIISDKFNMKTLTGSVPSPRDTWEVLRDKLSAETGIPAPQIFGNRPNQAQGQSGEDFSNIVRGRQITFAQDVILLPFIHRLIRLGILPKPDGKILIGSMDANGQRSWPTQKNSTELDVARTKKERAQGVKALVDAGMPLMNACKLMDLPYLTNQ